MFCVHCLPFKIKGTIHRINSSRQLKEITGSYPVQSRWFFFSKRDGYGRMTALQIASFFLGMRPDFIYTVNICVCIIHQGKKSNAAQGDQRKHFHKFKVYCMTFVYIIR